MHLIIQLQQQQIIELQKTVEIYKKLSSEQEKLNAALIARITELENNQKKNSSNSSKPPSSDLGKPLRTQSFA